MSLNRLSIIRTFRGLPGTRYSVTTHQSLQIRTTREARAPEFEPPMACVSRVMKASLPDNILLTKDARAAFVRAAGIFIFYLTHCSNDFCRESKRSTIFPQDVMAALRELGFEDFEQPLENFLEAYKKDLEQKKPVVKAKSNQGSGKSGTGDNGAAMDMEEEEDNHMGDGDEEGLEQDEEEGQEQEEEEDIQED